MNSDRNHAFQNPGLTPDEELTRRGYSMYQGADDDVESGRGTDRCGIFHFYGSVLLRKKETLIRLLYCLSVCLSVCQPLSQERLKITS